MYKIIIRGLNNGAVEEVKLNGMKFDRDELSDQLAELTHELIDRNLLSSSRNPNEKVKIFLSIDDDELLLCHFNGRLLCDLTTDLLDHKAIQKFDYLSGEYSDAYDLIEEIVTNEFSKYFNTTMDGLYDLLDEIEYENGSTYKGENKEGTPHGRGTMKWADGSSYEGDWYDGVLNGDGRYVWADGAEYTGEWVDGKMHGQGVMKYASGDVFEGYFRDGQVFEDEFAPGKWTKQKDS